MTAQQKKPWSAHRAELRRITKHRMVIMDGAMGIMIQQLRLTEDDFRGDVFPDRSRDLKGNHDLLSLTRPEVVAGIHRTFLEAGSDIIETNTFTATRLGQEDYGTHTSVEAINPAGRFPGKRSGHFGTPFAMHPASSVSGLYFSYPQASYFNFGKVRRDQVEDYALRRGQAVEESEKWLRPHLGYDADEDAPA